MSRVISHTDARTNARTNARMDARMDARAARGDHHQRPPGGAAGQAGGLRRARADVSPRSGGRGGDPAGAAFSPYDLPLLSPPTRPPSASSPLPCSCACSPPSPAHARCGLQGRAGRKSRISPLLRQPALPRPVPHRRAGRRSRTPPSSRRPAAWPAACRPKHSTWATPWPLTCWRAPPSPRTPRPRTPSPRTRPVRGSPSPRTPRPASAAPATSALNACALLL